MAACYTALVDFLVRRDRLDEAREVVADAIARTPDFDCAMVRNSPSPFVLHRGEALIDNLRLAGLPETR